MRFGHFTVAAASSSKARFSHTHHHSCGRKRGGHAVAAGAFFNYIKHRDRRTSVCLHNVVADNALEGSDIGDDGDQGGRFITSNLQGHVFSKALPAAATAALVAAAAAASRRD